MAGKSGRAAIQSRCAPFLRPVKALSGPQECNFILSEWLERMGRSKKAVLQRIGCAISLGRTRILLRGTARTAHRARRAPLQSHNGKRRQSADDRARYLPNSFAF